MQKFNLTVASIPKKFVWFRVAKVGTRSTLAALRNGVENFDIEQGFAVPYDASDYKNYFKFAFVRNPYERIISGWNDKIVLGNKGGMINSKEMKKNLNFDYFIKWLSDQNMQEVNIHFRPQSYLLPVDLDFLGHIESFATDLSFVLNEIGIDISGSVPHRNKKLHASSNEIISKSSKIIIQDLFSEDFERFGYKYD